MYIDNCRFKDVSFAKITVTTVTTVTTVRFLPYYLLR